MRVRKDDKIDWVKGNFWLGSYEQNPLGMTSWTLGRKSPIHTKYLGFSTDTPTCRLFGPSSNPLPPPTAHPLVQLNLSLEDQPFMLFILCEMF